MNREIGPDFSLRYAVLARAICDATNSLCPSLKGEAAMINRDAKIWIASDERALPDAGEGFFFLDICEDLDLDAKTIRKAIATLERTSPSAKNPEGIMLALHQFYEWRCEDDVPLLEIDELPYVELSIGAAPRRI